MILQPFTVTSGGKQWRFVDSASISSGAVRQRIQQIMVGQMVLMQQDAMCEALGIDARGATDDFGFGVYDDDALVGMFLVAVLDYRSGPWRDLVDWEVVGTDPVVFHARPMPAFPAMPFEVALDLSVDAAHHLLFRELTTVDGHGVTFGKFMWAIFKDRTDANSRAAKRIHDHAAADPRFTMTEAPDPNEAARTTVDIVLR